MLIYGYFYYKTLLQIIVYKNVKISKYYSKIVCHNNSNI